eukprot:gene11334-34299_t
MARNINSNAAQPGVGVTVGARSGSRLLLAILAVLIHIDVANAAGKSGGDCNGWGADALYCGRGQYCYDVSWTSWNQCKSCPSGKYQDNPKHNFNPCKSCNSGYIVQNNKCVRVCTTDAGKCTSESECVCADPLMDTKRELVTKDNEKCWQCRAGLGGLCGTSIDSCADDHVCDFLLGSSIGTFCKSDYLSLLKTSEYIDCYAKNIAAGDPSITLDDAKDMVKMQDGNENWETLGPMMESTCQSQAGAPCDKIVFDGQHCMMPICEGMPSSANTESPPDDDDTTIPPDDVDTTNPPDDGNNTNLAQKSATVNTTGDGSSSDGGGGSVAAIVVPVILVVAVIIAVLVWWFKFRGKSNDANAADPARMTIENQAYELAPEVPESGGAKAAPLPSNAVAEAVGAWDNGTAAMPPPNQAAAFPAVPPPDQTSALPPVPDASEDTGADEAYEPIDNSGNPPPDHTAALPAVPPPDQPAASTPQQTCQAIGAYTAAADDQLSFAQGETLTILDGTGTWWRLRK